MSKLEDLTPGAAVRGIIPDSLVTVERVKWFGSDALELIYKPPSGQPGNQLLYRDHESRIEVVSQGRPWSFDGDGALFRLVSEAYRIRLAHLFDPVLAVHTSIVEPLPHQITSVIDAILRRQPMWFLTACELGAPRNGDIGGLPISWWMGVMERSTCQTASLNESLDSFQLIELSRQRRLERPLPLRNHGFSSRPFT